MTTERPNQIGRATAAPLLRSTPGGNSEVPRALNCPCRRRSPLAFGRLALMSFWTNKEHRTAFDVAEDMAYAPSGGCIKMWLVGVGFALIPLGYGVRCLLSGHARYFGRGSLDLDGSAAIALAIAYITVGAFIHFHWFWGLHPRLEPFSCILKCLAALVFLGGFGYTIYRTGYLHDPSA